MKKAPCARLGMRIRPKISEKPDDNRNRRPPKATLFSVWMIQNCHCIFWLLRGEAESACYAVIAGLDTASRIYPTCGEFAVQLGQARVAVQSILLRIDGPPGQARG